MPRIHRTSHLSQARVTMARLSTAFAAIVAVVALTTCADAAFCHGKPSPNAVENNFPIISPTMRLVRVHSVAIRVCAPSHCACAIACTGAGTYCRKWKGEDGLGGHHCARSQAHSLSCAQAYLTGTGSYEFWIIHVYGTPYEMGYAHGSMMKAEAQAMVNQTMQYMYGQVEQALAGLPTWLRDWVAEVGLDVALDWTANVTAPYTGEYFYEEMHGLADGAGVDYQDVLRIHMIGAGWHRLPPASVGLVLTRPSAWAPCR